MEFECWNLRLLRILRSTRAIVTNKMKIVLFRFHFRDAKTCAMLPNITSFAGHAMGAIVLRNISELFWPKLEGWKAY